MLHVTCCYDFENLGVGLQEGDFFCSWRDAMMNSSLLQGVLIQLLVSFCSIRCYVDCVEYVLRKDTKMKNNLLIKKRDNEQLAHFRFIFTQNTRLFHLPHLIIFFITIILYTINHHYIMLKKEELVALGLPEAAA